MVEGPLAGSPAEEAGILGGETLTEIGAQQASISVPAFEGARSMGVDLLPRSWQWRLV